MTAMLPMLVAFLVFVVLSLRIIIRRRIDSWAELICQTAAGAIALGLAIRMIRGGGA